MIKINLLEVEKERRPKAAAGGGGGGAPTVLLAALILGGAAAAFAGHYYLKSSALHDLTKDVEQKRIKKKELEPYIKRVDELEARRDQLKKKNQAIEQLRSQRTIPVHVLDEVSRACPEYLWLTSLTLKGATLNIEGEALQEQAIPSFMKSLDASEFMESTSLIQTLKKNVGGKTAQETTTFKLATVVTNPFKPKAPEGSETTKSTRKTK